MEKEFCGDVTSPSPKNTLVGVGWRRRRRASPSSSPDSPRPPAPSKRTEGKQEGRQVLSHPSPHLIKRHHFLYPKEQIVGEETIGAAVTSLAPPSSSFRSLLPPRAALKSTRHTLGPNLSPLDHVNEGKKVRGRKTQVMIMGLRGEDQQEEEEEEEVKEEGVESKGRGGACVGAKVNNTPSYLESGTLASQVKGVEEVPRRLPRSSFPQHNNSFPLPPMAPSRDAGGGWGASVPESASAARLNELHNTPGDPSGGGLSEGGPSGVLQAPGTPLHFGLDPEDPLDQTYHTFHPGGFADGGAEAFDDSRSHDFDSVGGFGEVVVGQEKPHEAQDIDQFFHVNEVTVR